MKNELKNADSMLAKPTSHSTVHRSIKTCDLLWLPGKKPRTQESRGRDGDADDRWSQHTPGRSVRGERANFTRLVLGCIEAKFFRSILVGKLSPRSTQCTPLHRFGIHNRKMGKKGPGQNNPEKGEKEKTRGHSAARSMPLRTSAKGGCKDFFEASSRKRSRE